MSSWTKGQHVECGTWWDGEGDPPQEVLDARKRHGLNPDGSTPKQTVEVVYKNKLYDVAWSALTNGRDYGYVKLETAGPSVSGTAVSGVGQPDDETNLSYTEQRVDQLRAEVTRRNTQRVAEGRSTLSTDGSKADLVARLQENDRETKRIENRE